METRITKLLGIKYPVIQGGMAWVATHELASAVSNAGGLGIIGAGGAPASWVKEQIVAAKKETDKPFGVNLMLMNPEADEIAKIIAEEKVKVVTTGAGNPAKYMDMWKEAGVIVIPVVASVALAKLMERGGASAVIAEGMESGGHIGAQTTMTLVPQVVDAVSIPVIAAGGIADNRGFNAAFALGAEAVQMGTRFVTTYECDADLSYKQAYIDCKKEQIGIVKSPVGMPGRAIFNTFIKHGSHKIDKKCLHCLEHCNPKEIPYCITRALIAAAKGNLDEALLFCGANAWKAEKLEHVADIMEELK